VPNPIRHFPGARRGGIDACPESFNSLAVRPAPVIQEIEAVNGPAFRSVSGKMEFGDSHTELLEVWVLELRRKLLYTFKKVSAILTHNVISEVNAPERGGTSC
jgi:hypothetical protein